MTTPSMPARTPATGHQVKVEPLKSADSAEFCDLLALATPGEPLPREMEAAAFLSPGRPPFTHGPALCLTASTNSSDRPVGALIASFPDWVYTHPLCAASPYLGVLLKQHVIKIYAIAVHPDHRNQGIARALLDLAERRARRYRFTLSILEHERRNNLTGFYEHLGYTVADNQLIIAVPGGDLLGQLLPRRYKTAAKPLRPTVRVLTVPGAPAPIVSGLWSGCEIPPTARFRNGRLTS
ncbi:N-acetyltransferase [Streptomyces sp. NPDC047082]|uniref:GNAT family N-acetyltransferase n=1 Tax=Streptomyces sp. NPDC047082 TaxID=3155259 RepID=UPI0033EBFB18